MKKVIILIMYICFSVSHGQTVNINTFNQGNNSGKYFKDVDNHFNKFVGTWENTTGNTTFRVILTKSTNKPIGYPTDYTMDVIEGRFLIILNIGMPNEEILHNSTKYYSESGYSTQRVISGFTTDGINFGGHIEDTCASGGNDILYGGLTMVITNPGSTTPIAHWKVKGSNKIQGRYYSVPTDILLTKIN